MIPPFDIFIKIQRQQLLPVQILADIQLKTFTALGYCYNLAADCDLALGHSCYFFEIW